MQEQHHYKTTPEQGWSGMLRVLDQAMPVATRQRRFTMFWWTAAAVSTAAIVAMFVLLNHNSVQLPVMGQSDTKSAPSLEEITTESTQTSVPAETTNETIAETDTENAIVDPISDSRQTTTGSKSGQLHKNAIVKNEPLSSGFSNVVVSNNSELPSSESTMIFEKVADANNKESSVDDVVNAYPPEERADYNSVTDQLRMNEVITSLPLSELATLKYETELLDEIQPDRVGRFNTKRNQITPHISAGIIDGFQNGIGMQAAAGVNINIAPRLSVTSGVGYNIYSPDATLVGCACYEEDFDTGGLLRNDLAYEGIDEYLPAETVFSASSGSLNSFVSTIRQLQFNVGLKYDLSRRFFAEGGVALGFGTTAHSAYPIISFDNSAPISGDPLKISHSFDNVIKSNTTSAYAGIGYRLSPKTELYATATHSFDHYFLDNPSYGPVAASDRKDYIRGLNVGFRYNFQGP